MQRRRRLVILGVVAIGLIVALSIGQVRSTVTRITTPIVRALYTNSTVIRKAVLVIHDLRILPQENADLSAQVARLLAQNAELEEVNHENSVLRSELKLSQETPNRRIAVARVIARGSFAFLDSITIDHGSKAGLATGQAVTFEGALVGKISSVTDNTAEVELITSSTAITQGELQTSRVTGVAKGGIQGLLLDYIPQDTPIHEGDVVITSGLDGIRSGIIIGTVNRVTSKKNDIFQSVSIKPTVNTSRIDMFALEVR